MKPSLRAHAPFVSRHVDEAPFAVYLSTSAGRLPECNEAVVDEVSLERNGPCLSCRK
jgi:hypothetical protein